MIESILIKNFRGIQTGQIDRFRKFNLLVGPNNSGKSAVLEAIYLSCTASRGARLETASGEHTDYSVRIADRDFLDDDPMMRVLARHSYRKQQVMLNEDGIYVSIRNQPAPLRNFKISAAAIPRGEEVDVSLFGITLIDNVEWLRSNRGVFGSPFELASQVWGEKIDTWNEKKVLYCWLPDVTYKHNQAGAAAWIVNGQFPSAGQVLFYDIFNTLNHLPMGFFRRMIVTIPGWSQKVAHHFSKVFGIDKPFNVQFLPTDQEQQWAQGWIAPSDQVALTIDSYGDGARSTFKTLTPLIALSELAREDAPSLFIWEEPELFQNPRTLGQLLAEVAALMRDKPMQPFIATHSLEVVAHFTALVQEGKIERDDLMAFRLGSQEGKLSSSWFNADNLAAWLEEGLDPRMWGDFKAPLQFSFREGGE